MIKRCVVIHGKKIHDPKCECLECREFYSQVAKTWEEIIKGNPDFLTVYACCTHPPGDGSTCAGGSCCCDDDYVCDLCRE